MVLPSVHKKAIDFGKITSSRFFCKTLPLSRSPIHKEILACFNSQQLARIQHISIDVCSSAAEIAHAFGFARVTADCIFYYAYLPLYSLKAHSSARLTGYLSEWAALEEECANQSFKALFWGVGKVVWCSGKFCVPRVWHAVGE
jgi:hypothetical protein